MEESQKYKFAAAYDKINDLFGDDINFSLMNHGYYPVNSQVSDFLLDTCASMYCFMLDKVDSATKENLLDVGCGRGGGASLIKEKYNFRSVFGCDYNEKNIIFCKSKFHDISFTKEDAELLTSYTDNSFDCIINIESSQCYEDKEKFYKSVKRILKKDGVFLYADIFGPETQIERIEDSVKQYFVIQESIDITHNVTLSCEHLANKLVKFTNEKNSDKYKMLYDLYSTHLMLYKNNMRKFYAFVLKNTLI